MLGSFLPNKPTTAWSPSLASKVFPFSAILISVDNLEQQSPPSMPATLGCLSAAIAAPIPPVGRANSPSTWIPCWVAAEGFPVRTLAPPAPIGVPIFPETGFPRLPTKRLSPCAFVLISDMPPVRFKIPSLFSLSEDLLSPRMFFMTFLSDLISFSNLSARVCSSLLRSSFFGNLARSALLILSSASAPNAISSKAALEPPLVLSFSCRLPISMGRFRPDAPSMANLAPAIAPLISSVIPLSFAKALDCSIIFWITLVRFAIPFNSPSAVGETPSKNPLSVIWLVSSSAFLSSFRMFSNIVVCWAKFPSAPFSICSS